MLTEEQKAALIKRHATTYRNRVVDTKALGFTEADLNALIADVEQAARKEVEGSLQDAFKAGWTRAADWGNRTDLWADIDSPQYIKEMADELAQIDAARGQTCGG